MGLKRIRLSPFTGSGAQLHGGDDHVPLSVIRKWSHCPNSAMSKPAASQFVPCFGKPSSVMGCAGVPRGEVFKVWMKTWATLSWKKALLVVYSGSIPVPMCHAPRFVLCSSFHELLCLVVHFTSSLVSVTMRKEHFIKIYPSNNYFIIFVIIPSRKSCWEGE